MTFTVTNLMNHRAVVQGTDVFGNNGQTIVSTQQWDEIKAARDFEQAHEAFDIEVQEFFKPLTDAAERAAQATAGKAEDAIGYLVLEEGSDGEVARPERRARLSKDSIVLRLIEQGDTDRLMWVGDNQLEVLEGQPTLDQATANVVAGLDAEVISDEKTGEDSNNSVG